MEREIKFRAWDVEGSCITYDFTLNSKGRIDRDWFVGLMQYIGLKDKNGKEIYEGDICITKMRYYDEGEDGDFKFVVEFEDGDFWPWTEDLTADKCEVIGNKFENPELLK